MSLAAIGDAVGPAREANADPASHARMVAALALALGSGGGRVEHIETHISHVLVTPERAYKIKKPVHLGFVDFTTPEARRFYCEEEVRLNRRLAPSLYRGVVRITGAPDAPGVEGIGAVLEHAVEMNTFPDDALLTRVLARGALTPAHIDAFAEVIAGFHDTVARAGIASPYGRPQGILERAVENFATLGDLVRSHEDRNRLDVLQDWTRAEHRGLQGVFDARRAHGFVRECHGDLHLANVLLLGNEIVPFDCIEFNEELRWIDVMSEVAFAVMDLDAHGQPRLAARLLNAYLERTGDYAGLRVLRFYLVYRAMVRAKIAAIRAAQVGRDAELDQCRRQCSEYLQLALGYTVREPGAIVITRGFSGTGKTSFTASLVEHLGAVRVRSDVERKRLHGMAAAARSVAALAGGIYAPGSTISTYRRLADMAGEVIDAGLAVIVDATFLKCWQRAMFHDLAARSGAAFVILSFEAPIEVLEQRVDARARAGTDASEATREVLARQVASAEPLTRRETACAVACDATTSLERAELAECWTPVLDAIARQHRTAPPPRRASVTVSLERKLAFLRRVESYPGATAVDVVETGRSYVFLTDRDALKLKKPVRTTMVDLRTLEARGHDCSEELFLNRSLASDVYVDVVALTDEGDGVLALQGDGPVVDWLLGMRRLPADHMLDRLIVSRELDPRQLGAVVLRLCSMYGQAARAGWSGSEYEQRLIAAIEQNGRELAAFAAVLPAGLVDEVLAVQIAALRPRAAALRRRAQHVVEGHGDLRPEHVCLVSPPQIIGRLEFPRELRMIDPVDELAFLALECARLGAPEAQPAIFAEYQRRTGDHADDRLVHLYQSHRAAIRARLTIAHLRDHDAAEPTPWQRQARAYLELARDHARAVL